MKKIRISLAILLVVPIALTIYNLLQSQPPIPNSALDWFFTCLGLPIFIANLIAWGSPELIKSVFGWKTDKSDK